MRFNFLKRKQIPQNNNIVREKPKKIEEEGCEIKLKRDSQGRVTGIKTSGKCSKEHLKMFAKENNLELENLD